MNAKQEFIKAIMQVLRLEANIYTMGAIEEIIERLDVSDYTLFIAYLGERESNYEKPIESIAKGVNEFYKIKIAPLKSGASKKSNFIAQGMFVFMEKAGKDIESIVGVEFQTAQGSMKFTEEDLNLAISCKTYEKFKDSGFQIWYELEHEIYEKLLGKIEKPTIEDKIENKSFDVAKKTLGICFKALGFNRESSLI